ncbi:hypothetical protein GIB67_011818 [Kingdonia uniflora]|uniref:Uncharacterized protein n=1 Tax=Kingdonia uniflora TaxID=39325 RepID=A0A7J7NXI9_9MAGN|nr:hypothetical protein GIB67_011818 [Kingdonia uniflora]
MEISTDDSITAEEGKDKRKTVFRSLYCEQREEAEIEEVSKKLQKLSKLVRTNTVDSHSGVEDGIWGHTFGYRGNFFRTCSVRQGGDYLYLLPDLAKKRKYRLLGDEVSLEYVQGMVKESQTDGFYCYLAQFDYGLTLPLRNLAKSVMNLIEACPAQLNYNFWEVILVCETLNKRWAASGSESRITVKDFLEYYAVKYVTATNGAYLSYSSSRPYFFDLSSAGRVWNDNLVWVSGEYLQRSDEEPLELNNRTRTKGISYKVSRKESFIDSVAKEGTELEVVLKKLGINRFKRVASKDDKVRRSQAKRKMAGKTPGPMEENMLTPEINSPLKLVRLNEMPDGPVDMATVSSTVVPNLAKRKAVKRGAASRSAASNSVDDNRKRRKVIPPTKSQVVLEESVKIAEGVDLRPRFEVETDLMEEQCRAKALEKGVTVAEDEFKKEKEREVAALKLKEVRAKSVTEAERLVSAFVTSRNNLAGKLYQLRYTKVEILAFGEGNYEEKEIVYEVEVEEMEDGLNVAAKTIADNQKTIDQYEDRLDDNVKLSLKLKEAKSQVEDKTATLLSKDLALNQLISELAELKERAASGSRDGKIASGEGSREMKEILHQKEELVENMHIDLTNSRQKSIDLSRQMSECINQLTAELAESKACHLRNNKCAAVTHQSFKELVVHEQDKCDGDALHQRQLSALAAFFIEEIKFL